MTTAIAVPRIRKRRRRLSLIVVLLLLGRCAAARLRLLLVVVQGAEAGAQVVEDQADRRIGDGRGGDGVRALAGDDDAALRQSRLELDDLVAAIDGSGGTFEQAVRGPRHRRGALLAERRG